ncbi:hypothetical protein D1007_57150 [Hordeum vulgare]|nr:hypothetical protein D1007_57150 [Hordeum vulgare]
MRRLRRKNAEALLLAIHLSEREAAKAACPAKERDRLLRRMSDVRCSSDEDDSDFSITPGSDDDDGDAPSHVDAYTEEGHIDMDNRKGKGAEGEWVAVVESDDVEVDGHGVDGGALLVAVESDYYDEDGGEAAEVEHDSLEVVVATAAAVVPMSWNWSLRGVGLKLEQGYNDANLKRHFW